MAGDGTLINVDRQDTDLHNTPHPFLRARPANGLERTFGDLINYSNNLAGDWILRKLLPAIVNGTDLASMEREFSAITAMHYALLVQNWKNRLLQQGDTTVRDMWTPESVMLNGTQPLLFARLRVNVPQLFLGIVGTVLLILVASVIIWGHDLRNTMVRDGGVIDIISLLDGSSLPAILASANSEFAKDARREQAERTYVA